MKRKISTIIDESLFLRTKVEALRQDMQISEVISEALEGYLEEKGSPRGPGGVVANSWATIPLERTDLDAVLREEENYPETR